MRGDFLETRYGYCKCNCGEKTKISEKSNTKKGWIKGEPRTFLAGHNFKPKYGKEHPMHGKCGKNHPTHGAHKTGEEHYNWNGGRFIKKRKYTSYVFIYKPEHLKSNSGGYIGEHILVAEKALGKYLPDGAVVHHMDFDGLNNDEDNLMIFESKAEHMKFHANLRKRGENGQWLKKLQ